MPESRVNQIVKKIRQESGLAEDEPTPQYAGDTGWSWDREQRKNEIVEIFDEDRRSNRPHTKETLSQLMVLIEETEEATRNNPKTRAGMTWIEQSKLVQSLLYTWYRATKDRY